MPTLIAPGDGSEYTIECRPKVGEELYYTIESEFRDSGGVQPLLSYTTTIKERRFITQRRLPSPSGSPNVTNMEWECDRYEVRERAMKEEVVFDSLRHRYPPPSLFNLGSIPGSKCTFQLDPRGQPTNMVIVPAGLSGESGRGAPTKTAEKCLLSTDNVTHLINDLGSFFLPGRPVRVGAQWGYKLVDIQRNIGTFTTEVKCGLRSVDDVEGRKIAKIDVAGDLTFVSEKLPQQPPPVTTKPGTTQPAPSKPREFKLDRATCTAQVEFDVMHGELVQVSLHREQGVSAEIDGQAMGPMKLTTGSGQTMKATASHTPTPKPVIVGGKKPPALSKEDQARAAQPTPVPRAAIATSQPRAVATTRPTRSVTPAGSSGPIPAHPRRTPDTPTKNKSNYRPGEDGRETTINRPKPAAPMPPRPPTSRAVARPLTTTRAAHSVTP